MECDKSEPRDQLEPREPHGIGCCGKSDNIDYGNKMEFTQRRSTWQNQKFNQCDLVGGAELPQNSDRFGCDCALGAGALIGNIHHPELMATWLEKLPSLGPIDQTW